MNCQCGCGEQITPKRFHKWNPVKFKRGHNGRLIKGSSRWNWKGGKTYKNGYVVIYNYNKKSDKCDGYEYEHRLIMEQYLGRELSSEEIVHHINENRSDNRIENLEIVTKSQHNIIHNPERRLNGFGVVKH